MQFVAFGVAVELFQPPFTPVCRDGAILATFVAMPEAAVDEYRCFIFRQNNVGTNHQRTEDGGPRSAA